MSSVVIVAIPKEDEEVWRVSSEKVPHLTLLYLGDNVSPEDSALIAGFVQHAASTMLEPFDLDKERRGTLGDDEADVIFFEQRYGMDSIKRFRHALLQNPLIKTAYDSVDQYETWTPHLTLGYPATPAKEVEEPHRLNWTQFDKVAVWFGDSEGPTFQLKHDTSMYEEVAMSGIRNIDVIKTGHDAALDILQHHGVKGQKWGRRKAESGGLSGSSKHKEYTGEVVLKTKVKNGGELTVRKKSFDDKSRIGKLVSSRKQFDIDEQKYPSFVLTNKAGEKVGTGDFYRDGKNLELEWIGVKKAHRRQGYADAALKGVIKYAKDEGIENLNLSATKDGRPLYEALGFKEQPDGTHTLKISSNVKHSSTGGIDVEVLAQYISDAITEADPERKSMKQEDLKGDDTLQHYGVKGMRWGKSSATSGGLGTSVRTKAAAANRKHADAIEAKNRGGALGKRDARQVKNNRKEADRLDAVSAKRANKKLDKLDKKFVKNASSHDTRVDVYNHAAEKMNTVDMPRINSTPKHVKAANAGKLADPNSPEAKAYAGDVLNSFANRLQEGALAKGLSPSGKKHYNIQMDSNSNWSVYAENVQHSAEVKPEFVVKPVRDEKGFIIDFEFVNPDDTLAHYGVKGMRWGKSTKSAPSPSKATATIKTSAKGKTKIKTQGGTAQKAHADAVKAAKANQKLKKSGTAALSNKELKDLAERLRLEQQVGQLNTGTQSAGKKFIGELLRGPVKQKGNQAVVNTGEKAIKTAIQRKAAKNAVRMVVAE